MRVEPADLAAADVHFTSDAEALREADFHVVTVPTPVDGTHRPDLHPLLGAARTVGQRLKAGDIVVFESTVYPGATEEDCVPVLEEASGLACGADFTVGYSPERINPGDRERVFTRIPKIVAGQDATTLEVVADVYESVVTAGVHRVASIRVAEAAKVIENTQRDLNIALMNELALIFGRMGIDTRDVLAAAGTKWNFHPFAPRPRRRTLHRGRFLLPDAQGGGAGLPPAGHPRGPAHQRRDGRPCRRTGGEGPGPARRRDARSGGDGSRVHVQGERLRSAQHAG